MRVFGSLCYPHLPKAVQTGGTVISAKPHIFVGYDEYSFWSDNALSHEEKKASLQLFIDEVVPNFR